MADDLTIETQYEKYKKEMDSDLYLDRINLEEKQLKIPAIKGKWVSRLMNHKLERDKLEDLYIKAIKQIAENIKKGSEIELSDVGAEKKAESHDLAKKIGKEIHEQQHLIEYLEKMEKVVSSITYDIKNIMELIKMEVN